MSRVWITGYRSYELGVFSGKDAKIKILKFALKRLLKEQLEMGLEWLITGGQLGVEQWSVEVAQELKQEYPDLKIAVMLPFKAFGSQWNEDNQAQLAQIIGQSDFSNSVSSQPYNSPGQLINYQNFMLSHTDSCLLIYDEEFEGKTQYDFKAIKQFQNRSPYPMQQVTMADLQDYATEYDALQQDNF